MYDDTRTFPFNFSLSLNILSISHYDQSLSDSLKSHTLSLADITLARWWLTHKSLSADSCKCDCGDDGASRTEKELHLWYIQVLTHYILYIHIYGTTGTTQTDVHVSLFYTMYTILNIMFNILRIFHYYASFYKYNIYGIREANKAF